MSAIARNQVFSAVHTVGGLLPADMLVRISEGRDVPGCAPADYGVVGSRSVRDEAERHWDYLKSLWKDLRAHLPVAPPTDPPSDPTGRAVKEWVEPLFAELGFGRLAAVAAPGITADDGTKTFPVSHHWRHVPVHVTAWNADLDRRPAGAGTVPPQSLVQECLNRTSAHLWAVVTNGRQLRLLRDSSALATAAYVEFDLEAIFDGELFSEFVLLYRLLHATRFETADGEAPSACWLEKWRTHAIDSGTRALEQLRRGVQEAITVLGTGFLRHPANTALRENLDSREFHTALLRLVYRMLFLFVAEDRDALHPPVPDDAPDEVKQAHEKARKRYEKYFSPPPGCAGTPAGAGALPTATSTGRCASSWTPSATRTAAPNWRCPPSAACSTTPTPTRCSTAWNWPTSPCSARSATSPRSATPSRAAGARWTTATSTPKNWGRSTSPCWNWCPSTAPRSACSNWWNWRATPARPPGRTTRRPR
ncbi:hypothetical protein ABH917_002150 [Thermobifida halotolerans]|uniref:hypothetical protein n=1 Tax=Thermobifida halotolerans TaxID=483545 RepID=UPI003516AD46